MTPKQKAQMDRIRAARGLPPQTRENLMERVAAARCYIDQACRSEEQQRRAEMAAFLDIFHPELSEEKRRSLVFDPR